MNIAEKRILLVDDEPTITAMLTLYLNRAGYQQVKSLENPFDVAGVVAEYKPHVVLLDINMPGLDGLGVLEQMENQIITDSLSVIMVTHSDDDILKRKAVILGASDFISQPVAEPELIARVKSALSGQPNRDFILKSISSTTTQGPGLRESDK